ncbi:transcriptional regulator [Synergistales bacterium]|nr:transcriptional regulator [Synergistales bacterium]
MKFPSERFRNNPDASTGLVFLRAYNKWYALMKMGLRKIGVTHPQFLVMTALNFLSQTRDSVSQAEIARLAEMDVMSVSKILRGLEAKGYLARRPNPEDTRANVIFLLDKGEEAVKLGLPIVEKIDDEFFGILSDGADGEKTFRQSLHKLIDIRHRKSQENFTDFK